jgi:hypothetical protein
VGAVDDRHDALRPGQPRQPLDREELGREVRDVGEVEDLGPRRDGLLEHVIEEILRRGHRELQPRDLDALAPHALVPRRQHARVVLLGRDDLVPGLEVDAVLGDLQGLARTARQGHLLAVAAELVGHAPAQRLAVPGHHALIVDGQHVDHLHVPEDRIQRYPGHGAGEAVVEVDELAVELEGQLDLAPVEFVLGDVLGRLPGDGLGRLVDAGQAFRVEGHGRGAERADRLHERSPAPGSAFPHI